MLALTHFGDAYADMLRVDKTKALEYLRGFDAAWLNNPGWILVLTSGTGSVGSSSSGNVIHMDGDFFSSINAAANAAGGVYPTFDIPSQDENIVARIKKYNEFPMGHPAIAYLGTVENVRSGTRRFINQLAADVAAETATKTPVTAAASTTTTPFFKKPFFWVAVVAIAVGGAVIVTVRRRR